MAAVVVGRAWIREETELHVGPEEAWARLSDVEAMPRYWRGHRRVEVIERSDDAMLIRVAFAFPGPFNSGLARALLDRGSRCLVVEYIDGPFRGLARTCISGRKIVSEWAIELKGLMKLLGPWVVKHFRKGIRNALERLAGNE